MDAGEAKLSQMQKEVKIFDIKKAKKNGTSKS